MADKVSSKKDLTDNKDCAIKKETVELLKGLKHLTDKTKKLFKLVEEKE